MLEAASRCVQLLRHAELQACDAAWSEAAAALVSHVHKTVGACVSRKWQVAAEAALVIPALQAILTHAAAAPSLKLDAVHALRLTVSTNETNQKLAAPAAATLVALATVLPPPPPPSEGPKAALLARNVAEQLRDAALEALSHLVFMHRPSQDAALAADAIKHLLAFISCTGGGNANAAATQERALLVLANLTRGNVSPPFFCMLVQLTLFCRMLHAVLLTRVARWTQPKRPLIPAPSRRWWRQAVRGWRRTKPKSWW